MNLGPLGASVDSLIKRSYTKLPSYSDARRAILRYPKYQLPIIGQDLLKRDLVRNVSWQIFNLEFVDGLAAHITERLSHPNALILDAGAGNGLLAFWLKEHGLNVVAVDTREDSRTEQLSLPDWVLDLDVKEALEHFQPEIVICSWMPWLEWWQLWFETTSRSTREYILIGKERATGSLNWWSGEHARKGLWVPELLEQLTDVSLSVADFYSYERLYGRTKWIDQGREDRSIVVSFTKRSLE